MAKDRISKVTDTKGAGKGRLVKGDTELWAERSRGTTGANPGTPHY